MSEVKDPRHQLRSLDRTDFRHMNLPEAMWWVKREGVQEGVRPRIETYVANIVEAIQTPAGLWISGKPGVGKTAIAAIVAKAARAHRFTVYFTGVWELREDLRKRDDERHDHGVLSTCRSVDVLVLDDLRESDASARLFGGGDIAALLRQRGQAKRATIVTTQLSSREIGMAFGADLIEATRESMAFLRVDGDDMRKRRAEDLKAFLRPTKGER